MNNAVKYTLLALAPIVLIVGVWMFSRGTDRPNIATRITLVDVETGEIFTKRTKDIIALPAKNDRNGKLTLYPVDQNEAGEYVVRPRYRELLAALAKETPVKVDTNTLRVTAAGN